MLLFSYHLPVPCVYLTYPVRARIQSGLVHDAPFCRIGKHFFRNIQIIYVGPGRLIAQEISYQEGLPGRRPKIIRSSGLAEIGFSLIEKDTLR